MYILFSKLDSCYVVICNIICLYLLVLNINNLSYYDILHECVCMPMVHMYVYKIFITSFDPLFIHI